MNNLRPIMLWILIVWPVLLFSQTQTKKVLVTGRIFSEGNVELIGVNVLEIDKTNRIVSATVTDYSGNFSLDIKNTGNSLKINYVGYKSAVYPIGSRTRFDIQMEEKTQISEVVVSAKRMYSDGTLAIPQREISGAVQKINTKEFAGLSVSSIDDALQGRIAGLDIVGNSGNLGSGSTLRIRGTSSINSNAEPLIIVNDVPFENNISTSFDYATANQEQFANLLNISPDDIEEILVLKDGAAAAIWGSRGANGVISIRTKKGITGPTRVQYSYRFSGKTQPAGLKMLSGNDYTMMMKQAYFNSYQNEADASKPEFNYDPSFSEYENFNNNTDWVKAITQYGFTNDHNLTLSGGEDKVRFRMSLGYYDESGTIIKQQLGRITGRSNLEYQVSDRIKFTTDFSITQTNNHKNLASDVGDGYNTDNLLSMAYRKMPNVSVYEQDQFGENMSNFYVIPQTSTLDASQRDLLNPVALAHLAVNNEKNLRIIPTFRLQYDLFDPNVTYLRYNGFVSFDVDNQNLHRFLPREVTSKNWDDETVNRSYGKEAESLSMYADQNLTWIPKIGDGHELMVYGSWQISSVNSHSQEFESYGLPSSVITDPTVAGNERIFRNGFGQRRSMGLLSRVHYAYKSKYIADLSIRRDADSRFGSNNRWGNFPAASAKWIISDEEFMKPTKTWLSEWGIRAGYGVVGNTPNRDYLYFSRYDGDWGSYGNNYIDISTVKPTSVMLANLKWEKSTSRNLGFDMSLFDYKCNMDFNVYKKRTEDLLFENQSIPGSSGFSSLDYINAGVMDNTGWEFNISTNKIITAGKWTFDFNLNLSNYINEIVSLSQTFLNAYNSNFTYTNGNYLSRLQEKNALGSIYGFRYKGVYQYDKYSADQDGSSPVARNAANEVITDSKGNPFPMYFAYGTTSSYLFRGGDAMYEDINHDGSIDELDIVYLGNSNPKVNGGFGSTIRYKNFSFNTFFNFRYGNKILNKARMDAENMMTNNNQSVSVNWRWRKDGDLTQIPRALYNYGFNNLGSDRYVEDGSFLRLKYVTFSYEMDKKLLKPLKLSQMNFYLTLNNVATFSKYTGVDPEVSINMNPGYGLLGVSTDNNKTPRAKYFTLGVTVIL
ncbi:MAG TPA: SusC/RagA family TonB-linked outer membrane protein [Bacteroidales bacterium]|nr:SusC/RagA family TonB-linked outer membrane protein [Bacteroidales bacterium]